MSNKPAPKLDDVLNKPLHRTGLDVPPGTYPGRLVAFGEPFYVKNNFAKPGQPEDRLVFEASYAIRLKDGKVTSVDRLLPVPDGGMANQRSNLYKDLKSLGGSDQGLFDHEGGFVKGVNLKSFLGKPATVVVKANDKGFPAIESVAAPIDGLNFPTAEESAASVASSEDIPF